MYISKRQKKAKARKRKIENAFKRYKENFLRAGNKELKVPQPKRISEAEVQAELWNLLVQNGYNARVEVTDSANRGNGYGQMARFDIVVYTKSKYDNIIIEVKNEKGRMTNKQKEKYSKYKAHFLCCVGRKSIDEVLRQVGEITNRKILFKSNEFPLFLKKSRKKEKGG